jgi:DNA-binding ferritin-like protein
VNITGGLNALLADVFVLYLKTKNLHWHMSGPHFRDYHLLLDDHADLMFAMTDDIAERVRKIGGTTIRSIGQICRIQRLTDNDADFVTTADMLSELNEDEKRLVLIMRALHTLRPLIFDGPASLPVLDRSYTQLPPATLRPCDQRKERSAIPTSNPSWRVSMLVE